MNNNLIPLHKTNIYCFIADGPSKMPDDEALIVPQVSVNGQLGLPGDLSVEKRSKTNKCHRQDLSSRAVYPPQLENQTNRWSREHFWGIKVEYM